MKAQPIDFQTAVKRIGSICNEPLCKFSADKNMDAALRLSIIAGIMKGADAEVDRLEKEKRQ